jgi:hypothetical protein
MNFFNFSETSAEPFYKSKNNQNGGFLDFTDYSKLLFEASEQKNWSALNFLIKSSEIKKIKYVDNNGQTILHHLVKHYKEDPQIASVINTILTRSDAKDLINIQDNNGNTPLHLAVIAGLDSLCDDFIKVGANKSIKNKAGLYIESETETESRVPQTVNSPQSDNSGSPSVFISKKDLDRSARKEDSVFVSNILNSLNNDKKSTDTSEAKGFTEFNISGPITKDNLSVKKNTYSEFSNLINTSEFIDDLVSKYNSKQIGGKKTRKLNTNSHLKSETGMTMNKTSTVDIPSSNTYEIEQSSETSERSEMSGRSEMSELSRMINNQATEIHERTIKKIMEIIKVSEQEARTMKAYIYNEVKTQHPELNNFDRAVEMEKRITKEYLQKLDTSKLKELSEVISSKQKERIQKNIDSPGIKEEKPEEQKKETKTKKEVKETKTKKEVKETKKTKSKKESSISISESENKYSETSLDSLS